MDGQLNLAVGKELFVSTAKLAQARLLEPAADRVSFEVLSFKEEGRTLQLHPVTGLVSNAMIPATCRAGTRRALATVKIDQTDAPGVATRVTVVPAGKAREGTRRGGV